MENKYLETGTVFRKGDSLNAFGNDVTNAVRKAVADHRRTLQGPHGNMAGKRITTLRDGTVITTWINPFGLAPTIVSHVYAPTVKEKMPVTVFFTLYHGWLTWDNPAQEIVKPATVYLDAQLVSYLAGDGTTIPDTGDEQHLIGILIEVVIDESSTLTWSNNLTITDNTYTWLESNPPVPEFGIWTGEARGMNQALQGSLRGWENVFSYDWEQQTGWEHGYDKTGIFFDSSGGIWAGFISSSGLYVVKLTIPTELEPIREWLVNEAETFTEFDKALLRSWLFAYATQTGDILQLLTAEDVEPAFADGYSSIHPLLPWQWRWQPNFNSQVEIITTAVFYDGDSDTYYSRASDITITFDELNVPSANFSSDGEQTWGGSLARVLQPTGAGMQVEVLPPGDMVYNSAATVYRYTTTDGNIAIVTRVPIQEAGTVTRTDTLSPTIYGAGEDERVLQDDDILGYAGYTVTGGASLSEAGYIWGTRNYQRVLGRITPSGIYSSPYASSSITGGLYYPADISECLADYEQELIQTTGSGGHFFLLILPTDNGVMLGWKQTHEYYRQDFYYKYSFAGLFNPLTYEVTFHRGAPYNDELTETFTSYLSPASNMVVEAGQPVNKTWDVGYFWSNADGGSTIEYDKMERRLTMAPSNAERTNIDPNEWQSLFNDYTGTQVNAPQVEVSWLGGLAYSDVVGEMTFPDNIDDASAGDYTYSAPIGCA